MDSGGIRKLSEGEVLREDCTCPVRFGGALDDDRRRTACEILRRIRAQSASKNQMMYLQIG